MPSRAPHLNCSPARVEKKHSTRSGGLRPTELSVSSRRRTRLGSKGSVGRVATLAGALPEYRDQPSNVARLADEQSSETSSDPSGPESAASQHQPSVPALPIGMPSAQQRDLVVAALRRLGGCNVGSVNRRHMARALSCLDPSVGSEEQIDELLRHVTESQDDSLDMNELSNWILGAEGPRIREVLNKAMYSSGAETQDEGIAEVEGIADAVESAIRPRLGDIGRRSNSDNFHCILDDKLYLGGRSVKPEELRVVGITHVVRILEDDEDEVLPRSKLRGALFVRAADIRTTDLRPHFHQVCDFIENALGLGGRVYVHCAMGRSRSCTMVLAYLILAKRMPLFEAWVHVLLRRDVIAINLGFIAQLVELDEKTFGRQSLPLLAAFLVKTRSNRYISADNTCTFSVAELLDWWRDKDGPCQRAPGMARAMSKMSMEELREVLEGRAVAGSLEQPLRCCCYEGTWAWIDARL